jgi:hypothetical protein
MHAKPSEVLRLILVALLLAVAGGGSLAAGGGDGDDDEEDYTPRTGTPPSKRTGGASRNPTAADAASVSILAPAALAGLTGCEQPVIYWSLSAATEKPVVIGVNHEDRTPVLELTLEGKKEAGLHALDLGQVKFEGEPVKLAPGTVYDVVITVAADARNGSKNPIATARVMRVDPAALPEPVRSRAGTPEAAAKLLPEYAKQGLWLDYLDALNRAIEKRPADEKLLGKRTRLLKGEGLVWQRDGSVVEAPKDPSAGAK